MCGIVGVVAQPGKRVDPDVLKRMTSCLTHRGPDGDGRWVSGDGRVGFGHRRLSVIDLSAAGRQPMVSASGRYVISYNGEVYNFSDLRKTLEAAGHRFHGHSDTEVMLAAFEQWGVEEATKRFIGMFVFALWDGKTQTLFLLRDRLGVKPLYYWESGGMLLFASELRALLAHPAAPREVSRDSLALFLRYGYVPGPHSIFAGVRKLPPGCLLAVRPSSSPEMRRFWDIGDVVCEGSRSPFFGSEADAVDALEELIRDAIRRRMISDVPLGAFLSGGIDSSTVVALMQSQSARPINTFCIGFHDQAYNEAEHAAAVARHLGTRHTELYMTDADARDVIPLIPDIYDEPFSDCSQIPTFIVSRLARESVTVALSGDGGDELFGGYNRYLFTSRFWDRLRRVPQPARRRLSGLLTGLSPSTWNRLFDAATPFLARGALPALPGEKMHKVAALLGSQNLLSLHRTLVSQWPFPEQAVLGTSGARLAALEPTIDALDVDNASRQMCHDMRTYLVDDILTKLDRASMHVGLEARVPLLDHRVVEFAWRLPAGLKFRDGAGKWILRQILNRYVPPAFTDRPKMGFGVPLAEWLRGPLVDWAEHHLNGARLEREGYFDPEVVGRVWKMHLSRRIDRSGAIWAVLMFQTWLERLRTWS